jgi:tetratricopeptide (TPR) repeat protein
MSTVYGTDRAATSSVYSRVSRLGSLLLCLALAACGGSSKQGAATTPESVNQGATGALSVRDGGNDPPSNPNFVVPTAGSDVASGTTTPPPPPPATTPGMPSPTPGGGATVDVPPETPVTFPNLDPDPAQAKSQVDQQLAIAKQALAKQPPDADGALAAARAALKIDASSVDAAAYVAFAYYHKKQLDTAELVLDDMFKRPTAKQNANVYYVYGLVYDKTNRDDQAILAYKKAIELNPSFASALTNLGVHQLRNKQYAEAQATFERLTKQMGRNDAITFTSLGSAYRGRSSDYPAGSGDRNQLIMAAEAAYKRALSANANYGPAYYDLGLLYLDADPFPSGGGALDTLQRLNAAKSFLDQYKNAPGVDIKLYDERMKDVSKAIKREEKMRAKTKKGG